MSTVWLTFIAIALIPFTKFIVTVFARGLVEVAYRISPPGKFRDLLARDRASRANSR